MTDAGDAFVPTFSHQSGPAPAANPEPEAARSEGLFALLQAALPNSFEAEDPKEGLRARAALLRPVWEALPDNLRSQRAELELRTHRRIRAVVEGWGFDGPNLLLLGPTGAGKTSGAALLVRLLIEDAVRAPQTFTGLARKHWRGCTSTVELAGLTRWQGCRDLSAAVREHPLGAGAPDAIARCQNARLLVLDDVGATDDPSALERVLNARYERGWPTVTTSGLSTRELAATFGDALVRRMLQRRGRDGLVVSVFDRSQP